MPYSEEAAALTIDQQHVAVVRCCDDLLYAMRSSSPIAEVGQLRMRLAGLLHANLASEEAQIVEPIRRLPVADRPRHFTELGLEAANLRTRYSEHVRHWTLKEIDANQAAYTRAAAELVRQVKLHIDRKRAVLDDWKRAAA